MCRKLCSIFWKYFHWHPISKTPKYFEKTENFRIFRKFPLTPHLQTFIAILCIKKFLIFYSTYYTKSHSNPAIARKVMAPQKFYNFFQKGTHVEKIEGTQFSNINTKNTFYGTITLAESESDVRKILKKFWKKLWAKNFLWLKLWRPITPQDSSEPPTCYMFFWPPKDALHHRLFKSGFALKFRKSTHLSPTSGNITHYKLIWDSSVQQLFCRVNNTLQTS